MYLDPNLVPLPHGRRVSLVDDASSSGATIEASWALTESLGAEVLACGVAMRQSDRWASRLVLDCAARVVAVFDTPILRAVAEGWARS